MEEDSDEEIGNGMGVVIDNGSYTMKAGFVGDQAPRVEFSTVVGRPKNTALLGPSQLKDFYVGQEAQVKRGISCLKYPIDRGIVCNWDDMEKVWSHTFDELHIAPEDHNLLLTEIPQCPKVNREKMTQIMFETFDVKGMYLSLQGLLALYSSGRVTGMTMDSGASVTYTYPVFEGNPYPHAIHRLDFGGREITEHLARLITQTRRSFIVQHADKESVNDIKEKLCRVVMDYKQSLDETDNSPENGPSYELPDGNIFKIGAERFQCTEAMFRPSMLGMDAMGIHETIYKSIMDCDFDDRHDFYQNIVLSGGNMQFPGMTERLQKEMKTLCGDHFKVNVLAKDEHAVWNGGSCLAGLSSFREMWITKEEYDDMGPAIVHRKCC